jgi:hypothetical protein
MAHGPPPPYHRGHTEPDPRSYKGTHRDPFVGDWLLELVIVAAACLIVAWALWRW